MKFIENIADFVLENITASNLPEVAVQALGEGLYSDSLCMLAGLPKGSNAFEIMDYYNRALKELKLTVPDKKEAALILLRYYIRLIAERAIDPIKGMGYVKNNILDKLDRNTFGANKKFIWDCINMHTLYGLYLSYYDVLEEEDEINKEKTKGQFLKELKEGIVKEAKKYQEQTLPKLTK